MFFIKKKKQQPLRLDEIEGDQLSPKIQHLIHSAKHLIVKLNKECNALFIIVNEDELIIDINGIKMYIECEEDLFIVNEVFNEQCYGFSSTEDYILIDIGLNIGVSSLYFSRLPNIKSIYAFEPVKETFIKCIRNINLNPSASIINTFNFGLGNSSRFDEYTFSDAFKGSVGSIELSELKKSNSPNLKRVSVKIENASSILSEITKTNPNKKIIIKMDCEGGEYEIIPNLKESGILDQVSIIMMEWHNIEFLDFLEYFNNFNCFYYKNSANTGMLYASRKMH